MLKTGLLDWHIDIVSLLLKRNSIEKTTKNSSKAEIILVIFELDGVFVQIMKPTFNLEYNSYEISNFYYNTLCRENSNIYRPVQPILDFFKNSYFF